MVNFRMVNSGPPPFPPPCFRKFFAVFAWIPRFQNPVKYRSRSQINLPLLDESNYYLAKSITCAP